MPSTYLYGLLGGALIGLSAYLFLHFLRRVAGISGLLRDALTGPASRQRLHSLLFLIGLPLGAGITAHLLGRQPVFPVQGLLLIPAGLLVGFGTSLGSGCTSGHGICGLSRKSPRSLAATLTFMGIAVLTVLILRTLGVIA